MRLTRAALALAVAACAGCGDYEMAPSRGRSAAPEAVGVAVDPFSMGKPVESSTQERAAPQSPTPGPSGAGPSAPAAPQVPVYESDQPVQEGMVREQAAVGAGRKGHYSQGIITTPLSTYWRAQERITYEAQVPYALKLYKAEHGQFPKTLKEFEEQILRPNQVKLPELPEGHRYLYDPEKGELLVEHPG